MSLTSRDGQVEPFTFLGLMLPSSLLFPWYPFFFRLLSREDFLRSDFSDFFRLLRTNAFVRGGLHSITLSWVNMLPQGGDSIMPSLQIGQGWHMVALLSLRIKIWFPEQLVAPTTVVSSLHHRHCHSASFYHHNKCKNIKENMHSIFNSDSN